MPRVSTAMKSNIKEAQHASRILYYHAVRTRSCSCCAADLHILQPLPLPAGLRSTFRPRSPIFGEEGGVLGVHGTASLYVTYPRCNAGLGRKIKYHETYGMFWACTYTILLYWKIYNYVWKLLCKPEARRMRENLNWILSDGGVKNRVRVANIQYSSCNLMFTPWPTLGHWHSSSIVLQTACSERSVATTCLNPPPEVCSQALGRFSRFSMCVVNCNMHSFSENLIRT